MEKFQILRNISVRGWHVTRFYEQQDAIKTCFEI